MERKFDLCEKIFPVVLLTSFGLFSWAIRGQSGFGAIPGCIFVGTLFGLGWFFLGMDQNSLKLRTRPYNSYWSIAALIFGIGISGMQGWMQWPEMIKGSIILNSDKNILADVNPAVGYTWWFIVSLHWSGIGAILLASINNKNELHKQNTKDWIIRIVFMLFGLLIALLLFVRFPRLFLPGYSELGYDDPEAYPTLQRLVTINREAILWLGVWFGGLSFEILKKNTQNIKFILFISIMTGILWMIFQYIWMIYVPTHFLNINYNLWRCWETSAGGSIGISYGLAFVIFNKKREENKSQPYSETYIRRGWLLGIGATIFGMIWSIISGIKGFLNIYYNIDEVLIIFALPVSLLGAAIWSKFYILYKKRTKSTNSNGDLSFSQIRENSFNILFITCYFIHRILGLLVTGPLEIYSEKSFFYYYIVLCLIDIFIISYYLFNRDPR